MNVASGAFLLFGLVVALAYHVSEKRIWRQVVLLAANLAFLGAISTEPRNWLPYCAFLALGYAGYHVARRGFLLWPLVAILVTFFWLKKYTFLPEALFLDAPYVTLGMSYVLFRVLQLVIDTRDGLIDGRVGPVTFLNYTLNFTTIISGPIQRYQDYAGQQLAPQRPDLDIVDIGEALERIVYGYFKISVLGMALQALHERELGVLGNAAGLGLAERAAAGALVGALYPLYLYCNFSGYTDLVIGVARGCRLTLPENFDRPFSATTFLDFWGRWHMTLSNWLKTFVYSPLLKVLMQRFSAPRWVPYLGVFSFFFTFFLIGAWHGRTSVFLFYGLLLGLGVSLNKLYQILAARRMGKQRYRDLCANPLYRAASRGLTFTYFSFSLAWFWSNWAQLQQLEAGLGATALLLAWALVFLAASVLLASYEALRKLLLAFELEGQPILHSRYVRIVWCTALTIIAVVLMQLLSLPAPEVVYKAF